MPNIILNQTTVSSANEVLSGVLNEMVNEHNAMPEYNSMLEEIGFIKRIPESKDTTYNALSGPTALPSLQDGEALPEGSKTVLPKKGVLVKAFGQKFTSSPMFLRWVRNGSSGVDSSVKQELGMMINENKRLYASAKLTQHMEAIKVLTSGFTGIGSAGPGSLTPSGRSLFSIGHTAKNGAITYSNVDPSAVHQPLTQASLRQGLDTLRVRTKLENGFKPMVPGAEYILLIARENETNARRILNDGSKFSGVGANANQVNEFLFEGGRVKLVVCDLIGEEDGEGNKLGTGQYWFLINRDLVKTMKALTYFELGAVELSDHIDDNNKSYVTDIYMTYGADHYYGAQVAIFGSKGDGSTQLV